jgi:ribosomal protein S18 acetylase RimI-like enzyme
MNIRKATRNDLETITRITVECETDEEKLQYPDRTLPQIRKYTRPEIFRKVLLKEMNEKNRYFIVVETNNKVIGFGQAILRNDSGEIGRICIDRKYRKMGIGKELMKYLIDFLRKRKVDVIESYCYTKNNPSLKMHEKFGFKKEAYKLSLELK